MKKKASNIKNPLKMIDTAVISVNWNGKKLIKGCLDSLNKQTYKNFMVVVVDNGSKDGSVEFIEKNYPHVTVIAVDKNLGFTGGNDKGMKFVMKNPAIQYIATLNNDTEVHKDWLSSLVETMKKNPKAGSCSSKVIYQYDQEFIDTVGIVTYKDGHAMSRGNREHPRQYTKSAEVFGASAVAALWRREAFEKVGLFDTRFFMYQEEVDMAWRLRYAGYISVFVPKAVVYHAHSASAKAFSSLKAYYSERNRIWLVFKNFTICTLLKSPYYSFKRYMALLKGAKQGKGAAGKFLEKSSFSSMAWLLFKAWVVGILGLPLFIFKRIKIQHMRRTSSLNCKDIKKWMNKFGTTAEKIALLK